MRTETETLSRFNVWLSMFSMKLVRTKLNRVLDSFCQLSLISFVIFSFKLKDNSELFRTKTLSH